MVDERHWSVQSQIVRYHVWRLVSQRFFRRHYRRRNDVPHRLQVSLAILLGVVFPPLLLRRSYVSSWTHHVATRWLHFKERTGLRVEQEFQLRGVERKVCSKGARQRSFRRRVQRAIR